MDLLKNLDNMITAEDLLHKNYFHIKTDLNKTNSYINIGDIYELMIEFAKLHVEAALKEASEQYSIINTEWCPTYGSYGNEIPSNIIVEEKSILNAYSLDNIK